MKSFILQNTQEPASEPYKTCLGAIPTTSTAEIAIIEQNGCNQSLVNQKRICTLITKILCQLLKQWSWIEEVLVPEQDNEAFNQLYLQILC